MLLVVDKKVVKHLVETGDGLLEIPVRVKFEYRIADQRFVDGTMKRDFLYNRKAVRKHFPQIDVVQLDRDIGATVDRSLEEGLRYQGHASGEVALYHEPGSPEAGSPQTDTPPDADTDPPKIFLPGDR